MSEEREELRCCIFIIALIIILALAGVFMPYVISFLAILFFYWYISIPAIVALGLLINYLVKRKYIRDAYLALNTPPYQNKFEHDTGKKALENDEITDDFKQWLIQKVKPTKTRRRIRIRIPFKDIRGFVYVVIFLILLIAVYLWIYSLIFPEWRIPLDPWNWHGTGGIPGYDTLIILGIIFVFGSIFILKIIRHAKIN